MSTFDVTDVLHAWKHDDYEVAKQHILQMIGDISGDEVFGRQVIVAVYIRPNRNQKLGVYITTEIETKKQQEDIFQGKIALIVKLGPSAFAGEPSYLQAMFGDRPPPGVGDWVILRASDGIPTSMKGEGASRPKFKDTRGAEQDVYAWDGWPCRYVVDDSVIGRTDKPHTIL